MSGNRAAFEELWQAVCRGPGWAEGEDAELERIAHALEVAPAGDTEERAWALNALGAALAALGNPGEALAVLRAAVALKPSHEARIAAFACAAVVRCDQGEHEDACRLAGIVQNACGEPAVLRVLGAALGERARLTGDQDLEDAALDCIRWAQLEDAFSAA